MVLVTAGAVIGLCLAWAGMRALAGMFFSVASIQGTDPLWMASAPLVLASLALAACYIPARKTTRIDPMVALRQD